MRRIAKVIGWIVVAALVMSPAGCGGVSGLNWSNPGTHVRVPLGQGIVAEFQTEQDNVGEANDVQIKTAAGTEVRIGHVKLEGSASAVKRAEVEQMNANTQAITAQMAGLSNIFAQIAPLAALGLQVIGQRPIGATGGSVAYSPTGGLTWSLPAGPTSYTQPGQAQANRPATSEPAAEATTEPVEEDGPAAPTTTQTTQ